MKRSSVASVFGLVITLALVASAPAHAQTGIGQADDHTQANIDGTYTISHPVLLRGRDKLKFAQGGHGLCLLFGFQQYLADSLKTEALTAPEYAAVLDDDDGTYSMRTWTGTVVRDVTCYNAESLGKAYNGSLSRNEDGSYKVTRPVITRGHETLRIASSGPAVCLLFGFQQYLADSLKTEALSAPEYAAVLDDDDGTYSTRTWTGTALRDVTCYTGTLGVARKADSILANPDGTYTFMQPAQVRAGVEARFASNPKGICALMGFNSYLADSIRTTALSAPAYLLVLDDDDGTYSTRAWTGTYVSEVTCYNSSGAAAGYTSIAGSISYFDSALPVTYYTALNIEPMKLTRP